MIRSIIYLSQSVIKIAIFQYIQSFFVKSNLLSENLLSSIIQGHSSIVSQLQQLPSRQYPFENFPTLKGEKVCILAKMMSSSMIQGHSSIVGQLQQLHSRQSPLEKFPTLKGEKLCILAKISNASQTRVLSKWQFFNTYSLFLSASI